MTADRRAAANSTYPKVAGSFFARQIVVYLKCRSPKGIQWKIPHLRVAANRCTP